MDQSLPQHDRRWSDGTHTLGRIVGVVRNLSLARSIDDISKVVRHAARQLVSADGATFVLNDKGHCYYADEDAIAPLWKGLRFPLENCISGWAMLHGEQVAIPDIYVDPRIPHEAYRPTFVKSLVMTPIRPEAAIGAIGVYWADSHTATAAEMELLQALADTTSVAMENVQVYDELERRVRERTAQLEAALHDIESFSYSVSHDLRAPLRSMRSFSEILRERCGPALDEESRSDLDRVINAAGRMNDLIDDMLHLSQVSLSEVTPAMVNLSVMAEEILRELRSRESGREAKIDIEPGIVVYGDARLLRILLDNLLGNAWKYSEKQPSAHIGFKVSARENAEIVCCVSDNGAGFDMRYAGRLFEPFQRLHSTNEFAGSGIGLATAQRAIAKHGGRIWAEAETDRGARFYFSLPAPPHNRV